MVFALAFSMLMTSGAWAGDYDAETLIIKGDGVTQEVSFTRAELEAMTKGKVQAQYSVTNNFPTDKMLYRQGITLQDLLQRAGVKESARQLKFIASDGYARSFTVQELLQDQRYCFAADGKKTPVPVLIAMKDSGQSFETMSDIEMVLTMGQRVPGEQNNPWFVKYLQTIEVSTAEPEKWPRVTFRNLASGPDDVKVELKHSNFDMVKIYYTTDGTDPDINSKVYNVSASYYQPQLNQPIVIKGNTEIRAVAIGAGKNDSEITNTRITFEGAVFHDIGDYPWARQEIEDLTGKGIIKGMGDSHFAPAQPLTRAQFATMMVLALGEKPYTGTRTTFSDVRPDDWHYGYVEKAVEIGIISGYPDGTYQPDKALSRQEMLTIVVQAMGFKALDMSSERLVPFAAESRISDWAKGFVVRAEEAGIIEHGHMAVETAEGLVYDAQSPASRAEAAVTVYLMREKR